MAKKMGLGRGLSAILPDVEEVVESVDQVSEGAAPVPADAVAEIPVGEIDPNRNQPRKRFDDDALLALAVTLTGLLMVCLFARALDTFTFGDEVSTTLGIPVTAVRIILLLTCAFVTATLVSAIGAVGFVGLVIPHVTRMLSGPGHRRTIPLTFLIGAHFMILADVVSRTLIVHQVLPIGVVTALVGAPVFVALLYQNRKEHP